LPLLAILSATADRGLGDSVPRVDPDHTQQRSSSTFIEDPSGRFLFLRRTASDPWKPLRWDVPGGGVDFGETVTQAARREAKEESGISLSYIEFVKVQKMGRYMRFIFYAYLPSRPRVSYPDREHDRHVWLTPIEALKLPLIPGLKAAVAEFV
jgi:8-oxo-dGTP pyrophosphatase MutT (NUDIX family)